MDDEVSTLVGMYRDDDDDEAEEEVGSASSAAGRTLGVGPPNTSIRLALRRRRRRRFDNQHFKDGRDRTRTSMGVQNVGLRTRGGGGSMLIVN
jgi:hypothetical protein